MTGATLTPAVADFDRAAIAFRAAERRAPTFGVVPSRPLAIPAADLAAFDAAARQFRPTHPALLHSLETGDVL